jgi:hypothetical protein
MMARAGSRVLLGVAVSLLLLTACGGGSNTSGGGASTSTPGTAASAHAGSAAPSTGVGSQAPVPVESNPAGDIPDSVAFVPYRNTVGGYSVTYPEGWARAESGSTVTLTEKLNGIAANTSDIPTPLTVAAVQQQEVPRLQRTQPAFELKSVDTVALPAGPAVHLVYRRNSAPDAVTGRQFRDEVESYLVGAGARRVRLDLFGPVGADNVDAYRTISRSLRLS